MKKNRFFILTFFIIYSSLGQAQNFTDEGNQWRLGSFDWMGGWFTTGVLKLENDSTINGIIYKKINNYDIDANFQYVQYLVREDTTQKVFLYDFGMNEERLLYDFQAEVGDTIKSIYFDDFPLGTVVTAIDSVELLDGSFRKRQKLESLDCPNVLGPEYWIEGIGGKNIAFLDVSGLCIFDGGNYLNCFHQNGELLYGPLLGNACDLILADDDFEEIPIQIFPNPSSEQLNIFFPSENFSSDGKFRLMNVEGKILKEIPLLPNQENYILPIEKYSSGIYLLQYVSKGKIKAIKKVLIH